MSRIEKINNAIRKEISKIIMEDLKDPRVEFITVTRVETTKDLSYAKIYFSILDDTLQIEKVQEGLLSCAGFIRKLLSSRLRLRHTPELIFKRDKSAEYSIKILEKIETIKNESKENNQGNQ